jgi:hypothetical protein
MFACCIFRCARSIESEVTLLFNPGFCRWTGRSACQGSWRPRSRTHSSRQCHPLISFSNFILRFRLKFYEPTSPSASNLTLWITSQVCGHGWPV